MTLLSEKKKRKMMIGGIVGAVSGTALFAIFYLVVSPEPMFAVFIPIAAALGAGQMCMTPE